MAGERSALGASFAARTSSTILTLQLHYTTPRRRNVGLPCFRKQPALWLASLLRVTRTAKLVNNSGKSHVGQKTCMGTYMNCVDVHDGLYNLWHIYILYFAYACDFATHAAVTLMWSVWHV